MKLMIDWYYRFKKVIDVTNPMASIRETRVRQVCPPFILLDGLLCIIFS